LPKVKPGKDRIFRLPKTRDKSHSKRAIWFQCESDIGICKNIHMSPKILIMIGILGAGIANAKLNLQA
jgi:hypothetical protein